MLLPRLVLSRQQLPAGKWELGWPPSPLGWPLAVPQHPPSHRAMEPAGSPEVRRSGFPPGRCSGLVAQCSWLFAEEDVVVTASCLTSLPPLTRAERPRPSWPNCPGGHWHRRLRKAFSASHSSCLVHVPGAWDILRVRDGGSGQGLRATSNWKEKYKMVAGWWSSGRKRPVLGACSL